MAGLKTLAKELQSKGRNGDTMLAHINPQEAGILKALGGSGTINPYTGLPEYFNPFKAVQNAAAFINPFNPGSGLNKGINQIPIVGDVNKAANKLGTQIFQPLEKAIVQPTSKGLSEFDKQVARTIPGGYATIAQVILASNPATAPLAVAVGAARGAGLTRTGSSLKKANLQGAVIGGATAYASAELGEYLQGAVPPGTEAGPALLPESVPITDYSTDILTGEFIPPPPTTVSPQFSFGPEAATPELLNANTGTGLGAGEYSSYMDVAPPNESLVQLSGPGSIYDTSPPPSFLERVGTKVGDTVSGTAKAVVEAPATGLSGIAKTGEGVQNLLGLGDISRSEAIKLAAKTGVDPMKMGALALYGETSLAGLEERRKFLEESKQANAISQAEYDQALASINNQRDYAQSVVNQNPLTIPNIDVSGLGSSRYKGSSDLLYPTSSKTLYAMGGQVDDEMGGDYSAMGMDQGNLQKGLFGLGYAAGGMPNLALSRLSQPAFNEGAVGGIQQFAAGGQPRFLSGGGDGMSDSIKANINGTQPARLADGEFVIPADVVSHLGNGSSKAGAKQLYSMMDKIRKARTGRKSQGKQINPRKYLPA